MIVVVNFKDGVFVKKGDVLFVIDLCLYQVEVDCVVVQFVVVQVCNGYVQIDWQCVQWLIGDNVIVKCDYDEKQNVVCEVNVNLKVVEVVLEMVCINFGYMCIIVLVLGCVLCVEIMFGNVVLVGVLVVLLMMLVLVLLIYVLFDVDEQIYL